MFHPFFYAFPALVWGEYENAQLRSELMEFQDALDQEIDDLRDEVEELRKAQDMTTNMVMNGFRNTYRIYHL